MRTFFAHIIAVTFLLVMAGSKLMELSQDSPFAYAAEKIVTPHKHSIKGVEHRVVKTNQQNASFTTIEAEAGDLDISEQLVLVATLMKIVVFAFIVAFLSNKLVKRRIFYEAFIRIFSYKYIVLRTLRI